jgi:hypothetical protein
MAPAPEVSEKTTMQTSPRRRAVLLMVVTIVVLLRAAAVILPEPQVSPDSRKRYERLAQHIMQGRGFSQEVDGKDVPDDFDQPVYPYFLAFMYSLPGGGRRSVVIVQVLLELATLFLALKITQTLGYSKKVQLGTIVFGLACPFILLFSAMILTEVLATFVVTLTSYLLIRALTSRHATLWGVAGLAGGGCLLVRSDTVIVIFLLMITALFLYWRKVGLKALATAALFMVLGLTMALTPWMIRNYRAFHGLRPLGGTATQVRLPYARWLTTWLDDPKYLDPFWWNALDPATPSDLPVGKIPEDERKQAEAALVMAKAQGSYDGQPARVFSELAEKARHERPLKTFIVVPARRMIMAWFRMPAIINSSVLKPAAYIFWLSLLGTVMVGLVTTRGLRNSVLLILLMQVLGRSVLPLLSSLAAEPRYMIEALPACFILAAVGLSLWLDRSARRFTEPKTLAKLQGIRGPSFYQSQSSRDGWLRSG